MTVFKNMTNLLIAYGDWYFFGERVTSAIVMSFGLMVVGSVLTGYYDLEFDAVGYAWMSANCIAQVGTLYKIEACIVCIILSIRDTKRCRAVCEAVQLEWDKK